MKRAKPINSCLIAFFLVWPILLGPKEPFAADLYYRYLDKDGTAHYTDRYEGIPPEYKDQVQIIRERTVAPVPSATVPERAASRGSEEQARIAPAVEPEKLDEKAAQEKGAKEAEDKALLARLEKEKRIEDLKNEINSKAEEQKKLRTNWMVQDRNTINRLNQEIEGLQNQIKSIEDGLGK